MRYVKPMLVIFSEQLFVLQEGAGPRGCDITLQSVYMLCKYLNPSLTWFWWWTSFFTRNFNLIPYVMEIVFFQHYQYVDKDLRTFAMESQLLKAPTSAPSFHFLSVFWADTEDTVGGRGRRLCCSWRTRLMSGPSCTLAGPEVAPAGRRKGTAPSSFIDIPGVASPSAALSRSARGSRMTPASVSDVTAQLGRLMTEGPGPAHTCPSRPWQATAWGRKEQRRTFWTGRCSGKTTVSYRDVSVPALSGNWKSCKKVSCVMLNVPLSLCFQAEHEGERKEKWTQTGSGISQVFHATAGNRLGKLRNNTRKNTERNINFYFFYSIITKFI